MSGHPALVAAHVDAKITADTATSVPKTAFIRAANSLLRKVLVTDLAVATYVTVTEVLAMHGAMTA